MGKKGKALVSEKLEMNPLFTDTTYTREVGISSWEGMYQLLEEENPRIMEVTVMLCCTTTPHFLKFLFLTII